MACRARSRRCRWSLLIAFYCLRPRDYYTGTNNVEVYTYIAEARAGEPVCVPGLQIPAGTARIRLQLISRTRARPALRMALTWAVLARTRLKARSRPLRSRRTASAPPSSRYRGLSARPPNGPASLCLTAGEAGQLGRHAAAGAPQPDPPTLGGTPIAGRIAVWYLPRAGAQRSYFARAGAILQPRLAVPPGPRRAVAVRADPARACCPALALAAVRCLALAVAPGGGADTRRTAAWLFAIAALNFACWALITPPFQAPDEVDHFAYTQSLVQRGEAPVTQPASSLARWSSAEALALEDMELLTATTRSATRARRGPRASRAYTAAGRPGPPTRAPPTAAATRPPRTHGAIYYAALAPAYLAGRETRPSRS